MRITILSPQFSYSGGQRVIASYADRLAKRGHDVVVAAPPRRRPSLRAVLGSLRRSGTLPQMVSRAARRHPRFFQGSSARVLILDAPRPVRFEDVPDTEVVIATWWETAEWAHQNFPADMPKLYLIQHHEPDFPFVDRERAAATWRLPLKKVVICRWLDEVARDVYGDHDASLILNSVDTELFHAPPRGKQKVPTVGLLYSHIPWKGCADSLEAFAICRRALPEARLVAFGLDKSPSVLPPGTHYVTQPPQHQIRDLYAMCDVWLSGSLSEGFNLPPLEAMACRCPAVVTRAGAMPELIRQGVNGHLVEVGDVEGLARGLVDVLTKDDSAWREMSEAAHQTATLRTWDDATAEFEAVILQTASAASARSPG